MMAEAAGHLGPLRRLRILATRPMRGPRAIVWHPDPRGTGSPEQGARILAGRWHLAGKFVAAPDADPWTIEAPSVPFEMHLHGQGWLDDLLSTGDATARVRAAEWTNGWAARFGSGGGPGWDPSLTGRRLLRQVGHAPLLMRGLDGAGEAAFLDVLYRQAAYLERHWSDAPRGLPRLEALVGLLHGALALDGLGRAVRVATEALVETVDDDVDADGGIAPRNPEALLDYAMMLNWAIGALRARSEVPPALAAAQARIVPALRALRHVDGTLARFHGGGGGRSGRLDQVLAGSGLSARNDSGMVMGFAPMRHGRTSLMVDAAAPPTGAASGSAHASTLAFELSSGAGPVIVNCGPGGSFGPDWHLAGRATASHSTLEITGWSSARVGALIPQGARRIAPLVQTPRNVQWQRSATRRDATVTLSHDGYVPTHGLTHLRRLVLSSDGRHLQGEDGLRAISREDKERFEDARQSGDQTGVPFQIRFHLHPETEASIDLGGRAVSLELPSGEIWVFRPGKAIAMTLEPSVHLDPERLAPRPAQQVVLSDRLVAYSATIDWTLTRAVDGNHLTGAAPDRPETEGRPE